MATLALPAVEPDDTGQDTGEVQSRDYEAEARAHGWRPIEEFKGDPKLFVDAEAYAKRAEEVLPFVKKENKQLRGEIDFLKRQIKKVMRSEQAAYTNALADLEKRQENAVVTGDVAEHKRLKGEIETLRESMAEDSPQSGDATVIFDKFRDDNPWFDKAALASAREDEVEARLFVEKRLRQFAREAQGENLSASALFDRVQSDFAKLEREVADEFPTLKVKTPRQKPASDVAGVTVPGARRGAKTGANLPADAKEAAERYVRLKIPGYAGKTKAEAHDLFAKDYDWN